MRLERFRGDLKATWLGQKGTQISGLLLLQPALSPLLLRKSGILKNGIFSKGSSSVSSRAVAAGKPGPEVDLSVGEQPACRAPPAEVPRATVDGWGSSVPARVLALAWASTRLFTSTAATSHATCSSSWLPRAQARPPVHRSPSGFPGLSF